MKKLVLAGLLTVGEAGCTSDSLGPHGAYITGPRIVSQQPSRGPYPGYEYLLSYSVKGFKPKTEGDWQFLLGLADRAIHETADASKYGRYGMYTVLFITQETGQQFYRVCGTVQQAEIWMPLVQIKECGRYMDSLTSRRELLKQHPVGW